jgi:hypothetical protein
LLAGSSVSRAVSVSQSIRLASLLLLLTATISRCGALEGEGILEPGSRRLVITVWNLSGQPAIVEVAQDGPTKGEIVGRVNPNPVPPGPTDVSFDLPPGGGWAVWVNPGPDRGPLFSSSDIPASASGKAPFTIQIEANGEASSSFSGPAPGWFGE